jgi:hypothetical protein
MAYVTSEIIDSKRDALKALNKKYGMKATLSGKNTSTLKITISAGEIDLIGNAAKLMREEFLSGSFQSQMYDRLADDLEKQKYIQVNHYFIDGYFDGIALEYIKKVKEILSEGHWDESDIMTDYFHCSYYMSIHIGRWNAPYICAKATSSVE